MTWLDMQIDRFNSYALGNSTLADKSPDRFVWQKGYLKQRDSQEYHKNQEGKSKVFLYLRDTKTDKVRRAYEPHGEASNLGFFAIGTPILYSATLLYRTAELIKILGILFFRSFETLYRENPQQHTFVERFFVEIKRNASRLAKESKELWMHTKNDFFCAAVMGISAIRGHFSRDPYTITKMTVYFSEAEYEWNSHKEVRDTALSQYIHLLKRSHENALKMEQIIDIGLHNNRALILYQCLYPLPETNRIEFLGSQFKTYKAAVDGS